MRDWTDRTKGRNLHADLAAQWGPDGADEIERQARQRIKRKRGTDQRQRRRSRESKRAPWYDDKMIGEEEGVTKGGG